MRERCSPDFFEVFFGESQMHRLYLYYCYQLGILPKKQQPRINRPELERIWKTLRESLQNTLLSATTSFPLCKQSWTTARAYPGR